MKRIGSLRSLCLLAFVCGCASAPVKPPTTPVRDVPLGLNDGFHSALPPDIVARYCGPITIRTPQLSGAELDAFLASIAACPAFKVIALVEGPDVDLAAQFASRSVWAVEFGNELELPPHELTPAQYVTFIRDAFQAVRAVNPAMRIITGGVYTLNADTKPRITDALTVCPDCWAGVHLYEDLSQADLDWLAALPTQIAVTEAGFPTRCDPMREQEQKAWIKQRRTVLSTVPNVALLVIYQRPVGFDCSDLSTFGIEGHPAESLFH